MSSTTNSFYFRRRTIGRAASPPTWACYEQIQSDYSDSDSCSEDDEDYNDDQRSGDSDDNEHPPPSHPPPSGNDSDDIDMDMDDDDGSTAGNRKDGDVEKQKDVKGKQRAIDPEPESPRRQRKKRQHACTLRPILTIQKSQGFVWNQDLFVPPYIKDRYIASTSPPNSRGFVPSSVTSYCSATEYEVEVVEIRVREGEIYDIIP